MSLLSFIESLDGLQAFWTFQEAAGQPRLSMGPCRYALLEGAGPVRRIDEGVFGAHAAALDYGQYFVIRRADCPALDVHGPEGHLTLLAWIRRCRKPEIQCEAIAGMWNESEQKRQYALFLDLRIFESADQVGAHVSATGGPTPGHPFCMEAAIGQTWVEYGAHWECVGFTYDGEMVRVYRNGWLDVRPERNPLPYPDGLYDAGPAGADFTVGAVHRGGEMGNFFVGDLAGLLFCKVALGEETILQLAQRTVPASHDNTAQSLKKGATQYLMNEE